ncbi:MAG: flagellar basal body L-ring protein FlgH [Methylobacterium sp.]|jgi:flagellar L-ring protein precursor FlgH|nr:flagellar basal body L-ring protein FlgH [Methylobacterium sp.]MCA3597852.1 flagellar basal body L-ring protein FlgH [Methylobacterium sp.]MCA3600962.1 flagellar basal body L-ring protein FlgH [Methylobacterium sp.]MCA3602288.1 flagellar basal body L-ring protein FlgH [Methylobacterium sp.]MCA3605363.1 flagellar basal body L-ring protein FlgH [Methylobacterium sp.]
MSRNLASRIGLMALPLMALPACGSLDRLANIGKAPALSAIENPVAQPGYRPVSMPMPAPKPISYQANSLWRPGSRAFFKDQRAQVVGDLLTVRVRITDKANIDNSTQRSRQNGENLGAKGFFGYENALDRYLPDGAKTTGLVDLTSDANSKGAGSVKRSEQVVTDVAAVVTQVLPNGNLVIEGKQEVRVNFEVRELIVAGVVRPEDIEAGNQIDSTKIAQARIAYGGRGQITDVQQPRYGQQVLDVLLPF